MSLRDLMEAFATEVGLGEVELEEDGGARVVLGDDLAFDIVADPDGEGFVAIASVSPLPLDDRESAFSELLEANFSGPVARGASLGIDPQHEEIVLRRHFPTADLEIPLFDRELAEFGKALRFWRFQCETGKLGVRDENTGADLLAVDFNKLRV